MGAEPRPGREIQPQEALLDQGPKGSVLVHSLSFLSLAFVLMHVRSVGGGRGERHHPKV
jgi:hypothetical protein